MKYLVSGVRRNNMPSINAYWSLVRNYQCAGDFIPFQESGEEGLFRVWFNLEKNIELRKLRIKFPSLEINSIEKLVA